MGLSLNMKNRKFVTTKIAATVLAISTLYGCSFFPIKSATENLDKERRTVPFSEMQVGSSDISEISTQLQQLEQEIPQITDVKELIQKEKEINKLVESFSTSASLSDLKSYLNSSNEELRKTSEEFSVQGEQLNSEVMQYLSTVMKSHLAQDYRKEMGEYISNQMDKQIATNSAQAVPFMQQRQQLNNKYNEKLSNLRVEVNGKPMRIQDVMLEPNLTQDQFYKAVSDYYMQEYDTFANLYLQMIQLDKQAAAASGYQDAVQWRYDSFGRDYTPQDAKEMFQEIKQWIVPWLKDAEHNDGMTLALSQEKGVSAVKELVQKTDPLLKEVWNFMEKNQLFSFDPAEDKMSGIAFTTTLQAYDAPFVYTYWGGSLQDAFTVVHEFGHAVDAYSQLEKPAYISDLDKCETFSQGLEQVLQKKLAKAVGANPQQIMQSALANMAQTITYQAALEDFQMRAYALDETATPKDLAELFATVLNEYGYYSIFGKQDPTWFEVTHLFDAPFYTMSYVTSVTAALELGKMEAESEGKGLQAWLKLLDSNRDQSFDVFLKEAGIASPFEKGRIEECGKFLQQNLVTETAKAA